MRCVRLGVRLDVMCGTGCDVWDWVRCVGLGEVCETGCDYRMCGVWD